LDVEGLTERADSLLKKDARRGGLSAMTVDAAGLRAIATECVKLVTAEFDRNLDWRLESLETLDEVCAHLLSAGPLNADRRDLRWKLVGTRTSAKLSWPPTPRRSALSGPASRSRSGRTAMVAGVAR
jgi:hypothetical protein